MDLRPMRASLTVFCLVTACCSGTQSVLVHTRSTNAFVFPAVTEVTQPSLHQKRARAAAFPVKSSFRDKTCSVGGSVRRGSKCPPLCQSSDRDDSGSSSRLWGDRSVANGQPQNLKGRYGKHTQGVLGRGELQKRRRLTWITVLGKLATGQSRRTEDIEAHPAAAEVDDSAPLDSTEEDISVSEDEDNVGVGGWLKWVPGLGSLKSGGVSQIRVSLKESEGTTSPYPNFEKLVRRKSLLEKA
ncbi:unnamed protein product, partial [Discosporangium mesarthrocarpum]